MPLNKETKPSDSQQKKRTGWIVDFAVLADHRRKLNDCEKEMNNNTSPENKKTTKEHEGDGDNECGRYTLDNHKRSEKGLEDLEMRQLVETIQTTALLGSARTLRRVLDTRGDLLALKFQWELISSRWFEKFTIELIIIIIMGKIERKQKRVQDVVLSIGFQTLFVEAIKIVVDSWKFSMLLLYISWDGWPIFRISGSNEQLQQQLEYTLLKPDCHSWGISKMQSGREDILEEEYAIKFCFKLGKNATETYRMLQTDFRPSCMNPASVFEWHMRFKESRESVRDDERCGRSKEVNTSELIGQTVRVRVTT